MESIGNFLAKKQLWLVTEQSMLAVILDQADAIGGDQASKKPNQIGFNKYVMVAYLVEQDGVIASVSVTINE